MKVEITGTGTIGWPLAGMCCAFRKQFGIDEVIVHKNTPTEQDIPMIRRLVKRGGAKLCVHSDKVDAFKEMGFPKVTYPSFREALFAADIIIDCTPNGTARKHKEEHYRQVAGDNADKLFVAQGSEHGFGVKYMLDINDNKVYDPEQQFYQVVSCNTHAITRLLYTVGLHDGAKPDNIEHAFAECMRRATDISQKGSFVPSPEFGKHKDERFGTHHARDAYEVLETIGIKVPVFSTAVKLPTQYMHATTLRMILKEPDTREAILERLHANQLIAMTKLNNSAQVFSRGRDDGFDGRIFNQAVVYKDSLFVSPDGKTVIINSFTPQDGNSLLSSISLVVRKINPVNWHEVLYKTLDKWIFTGL
ncbi:hypothetical protein ACFL1U_02155 [Patescibacteria group bacterium]